MLDRMALETTAMRRSMLLVVLGLAVAPSLSLAAGEESYGRVVSAVSLFADGRRLARS